MNQEITTSNNSVPRNDYRKIKKIITIYLAVFFIVIAFVGGFLWGRFGNDKFVDIINYYQNYLPDTELPKVLNGDLLKLVWGHISSDYLRKDEIDAKQMYYGAVSGFVHGLDDPYTVFFDPEVTKEFEENISGEFEGIGAEIGIKDDRLTIIAPMSESPAEKAGILAGDKVYAIDGFDTTGITVEKAVKLIRGPKDTTVTLLIVHENSDEPLDIVITRGTIEIHSLNYTVRDDGIVYIGLENFYEDLGEQFDEMVKEITKKQIKGIILDIRNNPGGLLTQANYVTSKWLSPGSVIVVEKFGDDRKVIYEAKGKAELAGIPTVVLINQGSASGSEILAGALKDLKVATVVGETSFGKGSVQEFRKLPDGSALKMTIAEWLTPNETSINEVGIEPDIKIEMTYEDYKEGRDLQMDKAIEILMNQ